MFKPRIAQCIFILLNVSSGILVDQRFKVPMNSPVFKYLVIMTVLCQNITNSIFILYIGDNMKALIYMALIMTCAVGAGAPENYQPNPQGMNGPAEPR